jgi:bifunctional DNA-binding transcriptional regulator/antitoxin component of YhaV-PrlF toxin-antitoxin module
MEDKAEYSFWAKITENGCIDIPAEILAELDIEHQVNVCIKPNLHSITPLILKLLF